MWAVMYLRVRVSILLLSTIFLLYFENWSINVVFFCYILRTGQSMWYFFIFRELVHQCGIFLYFENWSINVVFFYILRTGPSMWYFSVIFWELVHQCGIFLYFENWSINVVFFCYNWNIVESCIKHQ